MHCSFTVINVCNLFSVSTIFHISWCEGKEECSLKEKKKTLCSSGTWCTVGCKDSLTNLATFRNDTLHNSFLISSKTACNYVRIQTNRYSRQIDLISATNHLVHINNNKNTSIYPVSVLARVYARMLPPVKVSALRDFTGRQARREWGRIAWRQMNCIAGEKNDP